MGSQEGLLLPSDVVVSGSEDQPVLAIRQGIFGADRPLGADPGAQSASFQGSVDTDLLVEDIPEKPHPATPIPAQNRFTAWARRYLILLVCVDGVIAATATAVPATISDTLSGWPYAVPVLALIGMVVWPAAIALRHGYRKAEIGVGLDELPAVSRAGMVVVVASALPAGLIGSSLNNEFTLYALLKLVVVAVPFAVGLSLSARFATRRLLHYWQARGHAVRNVVVVGSFGAVHQLTERIRQEPSGMRVVGACLPAAELPRPVFGGVPVVGNLAQVADVVRALGCDAVAVTSDDATRVGYLRELAWSLEGSGVELLVDPGLVEVAGPRMRIRPLIGVPLLHVEEPHFVGWRRVVKRTTDLLLTSAGLVVVAPLLFGIAVAVKISDGGPVLFRQVRVGRGGKLFTMLKFRSMTEDAEDRKQELISLNEGNGALFKLSSDPRVTRIGRFLREFSLDELPQLFNVLAGSMSLVGPRPHLADELAKMPQEAVRRSLVTPGLTGLWQISGRSNLSVEQSLRLDLRYVENWSFTLDLLILLKTASAVLRRRGAH